MRALAATSRSVRTGRVCPSVDPGGQAPGATCVPTTGTSTGVTVAAGDPPVRVGIRNDTGTAGSDYDREEDNRRQGTAHSVRCQELRGTYPPAVSVGQSGRALPTVVVSGFVSRTALGALSGQFAALVDVV